MQGFKDKDEKQNIMIVRKINPDDLKVIQYDGTNLDDVKKFIKKECSKTISNVGEHDGSPYLEIDDGYTLFLHKGIYIIQNINYWGWKDGFTSCNSLEELKERFVIVE